MYNVSYAEVLQDAGNESRQNEREAFGHAVALLKAAEDKGRRSHEAIEALYFVNRLWSILLEDLAAPDNGLPTELRADLISIGIWVLKEAQRIQREESEDFSGIRQVCADIAEGLG